MTSSTAAAPAAVREKHPRQRSVVPRYLACAIILTLLGVGARAIFGHAFLDAVHQLLIDLAVLVLATPLLVLWEWATSSILHKRRAREELVRLDGFRRDRWSQLP